MSSARPHIPPEIRIIGLTSAGRATVVALKLNHPFQVEARSWWVKAGWHPPVE